MKRSKANQSLGRLTGGLSLAVCFLALLHSFALAGQAASETKKETKKKSDGAAQRPSKSDPVYITSDWMEANRQKNTLIYKGRVVAVQADMTMRSDTLTAFLDPDLKQIREAIAEGTQVQVTKGDRVATGTKAIFDGVAQTVTLTGNPVVRQGNSEVSGERIIFFIDEDRAVAEGGKNQRVKATIFPEELQKQSKGEEEPAKEKR
jgi:lipopolysaccharide export system protein LptA